jgi:hypothetical protein
VGLTKKNGFFSPHPSQPYRFEVPNACLNF